MDLNKKPRANPAVVHREVDDDDVVLVNLDTAASLALNHTGFAIWQLVDGRRSVAEIADALRRRFPDAPPDVINDVQSLMKTLAEDGFVGYEWSGDIR